MVSANTVTIMQFKYTLDWFDIKPVDVDLAIKPRLTFEYRLGEWFLEGKYWDKAKQEWVRHIESINLSNARDAYHALKNHVTEIRCLHQQGEHFTKAVADLVLNKQAGGGECMTIQRYELLDLSTADGPSAMVTESEEGTYVLHADHVAEVAALKEEIAAVRQALNGYDNHAEPVAELVKAMRHRHDDYVESICELKARVAELGDLGQLKGDNRHIEGIEWKPQGDANEYALVRGNQWVAHIRMNGELTVPAQEAILGAMLEKRS